MANMLDAGDKSRWPRLSVTLCSQTLIVADAGLEDERLARLSLAGPLSLGASHSAGLSKSEL